MKSRSPFISRSLPYILASTSIIAILGSTILAHSPARADNAINQAMTKIATTMEGLFPIIFSKSKFEDPKNLKTIEKSTDNLINLFNGVKQHFDTTSPTYRISFDVIYDQLKDTQSALKHDNLNYARSILREFVSICTSCHTQDTKLRTLFSGVKRSHFDNDLQYAEFNYMTRNYDDAVKYYDAYLSEKHNFTEDRLMTAFRRIITVYVQIKNDSAKAREILTKYENHPGHTKFSKTSLSEWLKGLKTLDERNVNKITLTKFKEFKPHIRNILGPLNEAGTADFPSKKEIIARVWLRGQLYHYLNTSPPKEEIPQILYWLAIIDRSIDYTFYYSLADNYLKECILQYPGNPFAKKCYDEYETYVTFSFSGSRGTDIPEEVKQELDYLKNHVSGTKTD